jgi:hypothetical protein
MLANDTTKKRTNNSNLAFNRVAECARAASIARHRAHRAPIRRYCSLQWHKTPATGTLIFYFSGPATVHAQRLPVIRRLSFRRECSDDLVEQREQNFNPIAYEKGECKRGNPTLKRTVRRAFCSSPSQT